MVKQGDADPSERGKLQPFRARVCRVGPDNKLYITIGQPYNVYAPSKYDLYYKFGMGGIIRMDRDGSNRDVFAHGIRNSVGMDFAADKTLWFTDNQVDGMGDDQPPGELNHATKAGQNFGFPWYGGGHTRTIEYKDQTPPADVVFPVVEEAAHAADLGMVIYTGKMFPKEYQGAIFSAQHGSWNRTVPVGARVMVTKIDADGKAAEGSKPFAEGWLDEDGEYTGRPWTSSRCATARCSSRTISRARSTVSPTTARNRIIGDYGKTHCDRRPSECDRHGGAGRWVGRGWRSEDQDLRLHHLSWPRRCVQTAGSQISQAKWRSISPRRFRPIAQARARTRR